MGTTGKRGLSKQRMVRITDKRSLAPDITVLAYQIGPYGGGIEQMILQVAKGLQSVGCQVRGISTSSAGGKIVLEGVPVYAIQPQNIWLRRIYSRCSRFCISYFLGKSARFSDIILVSHFYLLKHALKVAYKYRNKVWVVAHGIEIWRDWNDTEKELLEKCDKIIAVSRYTADSLVGRLSNSIDRVVVIPNMTDPDWFKPNWGLVADIPRIILTVGRLSSSEAYKGHDLIIQSLSGVEKQLKISVEYHIVGEGDDKARLQRIAQDCEVSKKVHFLGRLEGNDFLKEYQKCHVFAMPSYVSQRPDGSWTGEGFGIVYIEAAACGKPVLACDVGGQVDCIRHGETGILVKPTVEAVESGLVQILGNLDKSRQMGMAGRQFVLDNFTKAHFYKKWAKLVQDIR